MIKETKYGRVTWVDAESPTADELRELAERYSFHPVVEAELTAPSLRSKVDVYSNLIYLILHFPLARLSYGKDEQLASGLSVDRDTEEIDFALGKDFLITVRYAPSPAIDDFSKIFSHLTTTKNRSWHAGHLLFYLLKHYYSLLQSDLDYVNVLLKRAETRIFGGQEKMMIKHLSDINRSLLDFRWALKNHREVLDSFAVAGTEFFGDKFKYYVSSMLGEYGKVWTALGNNRETFFDLRDTNNSLLSIKTGETVKFLTVVAFIFLPLTLVTQIFGMNTSHPLENNRYDFLVVLGFLLIVTMTMSLLVRSKKWL